MTKIKLIVVDDYEIVRQGLEAIFIGLSDIEIVASAACAEELFHLLAEHKPDIILLDIKLPGMSGIEIARVLSKDYPNIKLIMLTSMTDEISVALSLRAGAIGFLPKDAHKDEVIRAIRTVHSGKRYFGDEISQIIFENYSTQLKLLHSPIDLISKRETEIIKQLANGLQHKEIANNLCISVRTVETHKKNILEKLQLKTSIDLLKFAIKYKIVSI